MTELTRTLQSSRDSTQAELAGRPAKQQILPAIGISVETLRACLAARHSIVPGWVDLS
jgi:hypothetical protein